VPNRARGLSRPSTNRRHTRAVRRIPHRAHNAPGQPTVLLAIPDTVMSNATSQMTGIVFNSEMPPAPFYQIIYDKSDASENKILEQLFREQVETWKNDTQHWSSMPRITSHPSYLRIIGLAGQFGKKAVEKLILRELGDDPYHWFDALEAITGKNPVKPDDDFDTAVNAWLEWGRQEGIFANDHTTGTQF
jgi:hypothetical protein